MAGNPKELATDVRSGHTLLFEHTVKEADALSFAEMVIGLHARIIHTSMSLREAYGLSVISVNAAGNCMAAPIRAEDTYTPEPGYHAVAVANWHKPFRPDGPSSAHIYTRLAQQNAQVFHSMLIADVSAYSSLILTSQPLQEREISPLSFQNHLQGLAALNLLVLDTRES